jgi:hypothetical protein
MRSSSELGAATSDLKPPSARDVRLRFDLQHRQDAANCSAFCKSPQFYRRLKGMHRTHTTALALALFLMTSFVIALADDGSDYEQAIPQELRGPFVSRPDVVPLLECPNSDCRGPLSFVQLIEARLPPSATRTMANDNPFNHPVAEQIRTIISGDIEERSGKWGLADDKLNQKFLTDPNSRVQLVGIVNRMDRQFIKDPARAAGEQRNCGEISVIYRFFYSIRDGRQSSRLPVTMNLVFPAVPSDTRGGAITCAAIAQRWLDEMARPLDRSPAQIVRDLTDPSSGPLSTISGHDLERLELNVQAYRAPTSASPAVGFGTRSEYIIRVFEWSKKQGIFIPRFLNNQIDRDQLLCAPNDTGDCALKEALRRKLVSYLQSPATVSAIDLGELDIPLSIAVRDRSGQLHRALAARGISIAPGGSHRSGNQPFWDSNSAKLSSTQEIISDDEISVALQNGLE